MTVKPHRQFPEATRPGLVVLSHLGWDFVWQRPQHLMTHAAATRPVLFVECPQFRPGITPHMQSVESGGVLVCRPQIPEGHDAATSQRMTAEVLAAHVRMLRLDVYDLWVYTPMELPVAALLEPRLVVYDCMDELSQFRFAPPELAAREAELLDRADVVFTGGYRLYEAKARLHGNAHPFPSSVDVGHFRRARGSLPDPVDQRAIGRPRLGWCGVIDERLDYDLIATVAAQRPEWQWVLVGPTAKIDPAGLPRAENLHYLGSKQYQDLPAHLAHWDVALMPFALTEATEFISPTKTPEYLAAGLPVVSTPIADVVRPWGEEGLVRIADGPRAFEQACADALTERGGVAERIRRRRADQRLATMSWGRTWAAMAALLEDAVAGQRAAG